MNNWVTLLPFDVMTITGGNLYSSYAYMPCQGFEPETSGLEDDCRSLRTIRLAYTCFISLKRFRSNIYVAVYQDSMAFYLIFTAHTRVLAHTEKGKPELTIISSLESRL